MNLLSAVVFAIFQLFYRNMKNSDWGNRRIEFRQNFFARPPKYFGLVRLSAL